MPRWDALIDTEAVTATGPYGPDLAETNDSAAVFSVPLVNPQGNVIADTETTPGTYTVTRVRAGTSTAITAATASTEADGIISATIDLSDGNWAGGDLGYIEFSGIVATIASVATSMPVLRKYFRITQEADIETDVDAIVAALYGAAGVVSWPAEAAPGDGVSLAEVIRAIHVDVTGIAGSAMRGTDSAALAAVLGALDDAAAAGAVTNADTGMAYLKQLINMLNGAAGVVSWPAGAAPADGVSFSEAVRKIAEDLVLVLADTGTDGVVVNTRTAAADRIAGETQVIEVSVTAALNAGITTVATVTTQPCVIDSIVVHADTGAHADMTTCALEGGVGQVVEFIGVGDATEANLNAADKQVSWTGAVRFAVGKIVYIDLQGTGATAADLTVTITYHAAVDGGYLA